ncbi:MAG: 23S rRNA (guanosine(2251)-2'-O)-methyltransferase RlmB [Alphaproteobacteria bacterium]|nr:23S rRNA (guanosine(2251)-2'-O)-methyltransferase RlmB [Alphaproteobacteria bacterium]
MAKYNRGNQQQQNNASGIVLYGKHSVFSALKNPNRRFNKILCTKENFAEFKAACEQNKINATILNVVDRKEIEKVAGNEAVHQGVLAYCKELDNYLLDDILTLAEDKERCHVLILDQVTDPQNIGAIIRSCAAFNTLALIVQDKNSPRETGAMVRASAGTIDMLPICRVTNLSRAIEQLKEANFWIVGMDGSAKQMIDELAKGGKTAIVMGSEGKGMRRLVEENCDITVKLPISSDVESLNVSTAAAIALYELNK